MSTTQSSSDRYPPASVSVVIPTYNRAYIIGDALQSALAQTYRDFEIVVVDDGSSDNTREVIESFQDSKIRYIRHDRNRGCSAAANTGIEAARGSIVAFLDSDDQWKPEYLELQVRFLSRHPQVGVVFCNTVIENRDGTSFPLMSAMEVFPNLVMKNAPLPEYVISSRQIYLCLLQEVPVKPSAAVVRRELFKRVGLFNEAWPSGTDWDLFLRLSRVTDFGYIDRTLVLQVRTEDATHRVFREQDKLFLINIFLKEKTALANDHEALVCVNRGLSDCYNGLGWHYFLHRRDQESMSTYYRGFKETRELRLLRKLAAAALRIAFTRGSALPAARA